MSTEQPIGVGEVRLRGVSRKFKVVHERSATLKETLIRRRRSSYTELWAVKDVDLDIRRGEAVAIVGRNGSGKSTLLKMLAGIYGPHVGTIEVGGTMSSMLELGAGFHPDFTGRENVFMNGAIHGLSERQVRERLDEIIDFAQLHEFIDMPVRTYSSGMQMRLAFSVAAHVEPDILLLDEVLAVGDEAFQRKCMGRIYDFLHGGGTLVFVSHDPNAVEQTCDRAILMDSGRVVQDDIPARVMETYHRLLAEGTDAIGAEVTHDTDHPEEHEAPSALGGWGTGEIAITSVSLSGAAGPADRFVSGEPFTVNMELLAREDLDAPNIGVSIASGDGTVCFGTNTRLDDVATPNVNGSLSVRFSVEHLPLHEGRFDVTVAVHSHDEKIIYHWIDRAASFAVFQQRPGVGLVAMAPSWQFDSLSITQASGRRR